MTTDYYWNCELVKRDNKLYIRTDYNMFTEPKIVTHYWPISHSNGSAGDTFPLPAHREDSGLYTVRREADLKKNSTGYGAHFEVYLTEGGATKAEFTESREISCPKVRKGIETRYRDGAWQKYMKREGWITA